MSMPNDASTPEIFENRNGLSFVTTVSSQAEPFRSSETWTSSGWMSRASRTCRSIAVTRREKLRELGLAPIDQLVAVSERQLVVGIDVQPPEQLFLPGCERLEADGFDVGQGQEAEHLQSLSHPDQRGEPPDRLRI